MAGKIFGDMTLREQENISLGPQEASLLAGCAGRASPISKSEEFYC